MAGDDVAVVRQRIAALTGDLGAEQGAEGPVRGGDLEVQFAGLLALQTLAQLFHQHAHVHRLFQMEVVDGLGVKMRDMVAVGIVEQGGQVQGLRPMGDQLFPDPQQVAAAHQLVHGADAQLRHVLP